MRLWPTRRICQPSGDRQLNRLHDRRTLRVGPFKILYQCLGLHSAALGIAQTNDLGLCLAQHRGRALDLACRLKAPRASSSAASLLAYPDRSSCVKLKGMSLGDGSLKTRNSQI